MAAGERLDEGVCVLAPLHRQRRQVQARDPALGAGLERGDVLRLQLQFHHVVQERGDLLSGKAQVVGA